MERRIEGKDAVRPRVGQKIALAEKKPYCSPRLVVYGDLRRVTMGGGGAQTEVGPPSSRAV